MVSGGAAGGLNSKNPVRLPRVTRQISIMRKLCLTFIVALLAVSAFAQTKTLLNLDKSGLAIQGYDPVFFFTDGKPAKGRSEFFARHNGALYYFASKEHR